MPQYKAIIFDVDGTLINGQEGILSSVMSTVEYFKLRKLSNNDLLSFVGPPIQNSFMKYYEVNESVAQEYANYFRECYSNGDVFKAYVYDGIYELLAYLKEKGYMLAIATYKRQDYATKLSKFFKFDKYFDFVCGADNKNKLTKKDIINQSIMLCGCQNKDVVMIGDSFHDAKASTELGIDFIGVTYGFGFKTKEEINIYNPIYCANNTKEIISFFARV